MTEWWLLAFIAITVLYFGVRLVHINVVAADENEKRLNRIIELLERKE